MGLCVLITVNNDVQDGDHGDGDHSGGDFDTDHRGGGDQVDDDQVRGGRGDGVPDVSDHGGDDPFDLDHGHTRIYSAELKSVKLLRIMRN